MKRITWVDFVSDHVCKIPGQRNAVEAEQTLTEFGKVIKPKGPHAVTFGMIESYVAALRKRGNAAATINKKCRYIRAAMNKAVKRGYAGRNPMSDGWEWQAEEQRIPRALSADEKAKLLKACPTRQWRTFVRLALNTGCRRSELLGLTWNRVDFENARIVITGTKAKRDRVQPLTPDDVVALRELQATTLKHGGPFVSLLHNPGRDFQAIVKAASIAHCSLHDLRRTFCTDLARLNVNQLIVQQLAGHAHASTTAKYYQAVDDAMKRNAVLRLSEAG